MMGISKNIKTKYNIQVQNLHCDNMGEMWILKGLANRKGWGWSLSILLQILLNRMSKLNRSSLFCSTRYMTCSQVIIHQMDLE